ncbi:MAG: CPBP family intramembrane metalloprotease [Anaerolineaceae bacterium]|nr:CPBP family intramembrane metalloprotease [Anaerolineaceae bacterium]
MPEFPPKKPSSYLIGFLAAVALIALVWLPLRLAFSIPDFSLEGKLAVLAGLALLFLLAGLAGITIVLRRRRGRADQQLQNTPILLVLSLAYLVPVLAFVVPEILNGRTNISDPVLQKAAGQPWVFLWQALILAVFMAFQYWQQSRSLSGMAGQPLKVTPLTIDNFLAGPLVGLGLWLVSYFCYNLLTPPAPHIPDPTLEVTLPALPFALHAAVIFIALAVAPWAEESLFRGRIFPRWQAKIGVWGLLLSAALYATLQFRPLLWLPAFILALGLSLVVRASGRLAPAVIAHIVFNLLMLLVGWQMVL